MKPIRYQSLRASAIPELIQDYNTRHKPLAVPRVEEIEDLLIGKSLRAKGWKVSATLVERGIFMEQLRLVLNA